MTVPPNENRINLQHLLKLMGPHGLFEHALFREPRLEHGYCTDDNARAVVITAAMEDAAADAIFDRCLRFVADAFTPEGFRNRRSSSGDWLDGLGSEDAHGRAVWGLGVAARYDRLPPELLPTFDVACLRPLTAPRAIAYALLGATAAVDHVDAAPAARAAIARLGGALPAVRPGSWPWPEDRLTYANARIPQAMILVGQTTGDRLIRNIGLHLLDWLVKVETGPEGFSFTPVAGRGPGETGPAFDQQPIEAWAMADACETAALATGGAAWRTHALRAFEWFHGRNDVGVAMYDPATGAGYDGLEADGANLNCGAESTLSALGAAQVRERLLAVPATVAAL
ncbi:MAG TPA: glycosyltransferase [Acidimicrobiia bacterium]|nr:glycosyltransferase [Acidimicrobiia bacterium]